MTLLLPPVMLFAIGYLCARSTRSLRFGLETGVVAALTTLVAVAVVYGVEAAHWYHVAPDVSVLDATENHAPARVIMRPDGTPLNDPG